MNQVKSLARRAGWLWGLHGVPAPFAYVYLPSLLLVPGDPVATAERVRTFEGLLRIGVLAELLIAALLIFAMAALYRLFHTVDETVSLILAAMMLASVPISFVNAIFNVAPLVLINSPAVVSEPEFGQTAALLTLFLRLHAYGLVVNQVLWGLWLFPFGILVMRSGFIPRALAYPLFVAGTAYLLATLGYLFLPPDLRWIAQSVMVLGVGELPVLVWLLVWGARTTITSYATTVGIVATIGLCACTGVTWASRHPAFAPGPSWVYGRWQVEVPDECPVEYQ